MFLVWLREMQERRRLEQRFAGLPKLKPPRRFYADTRTLRIIKEGTMQGNLVRRIQILGYRFSGVETSGIIYEPTVNVGN